MKYLSQILFKVFQKNEVDSEKIFIDILYSKYDQFQMDIFYVAYTNTYLKTIRFNLEV
jgi:hypothetical protein